MECTGMRSGARTRVNVCVCVHTWKSVCVYEPLLGLYVHVQVYVRGQV